MPGRCATRRPRPPGATAAGRAATAAADHPAGARLYTGACAVCHETGAAMVKAGRPVLPLGTPLHEDHLDDLIDQDAAGAESTAWHRVLYVNCTIDGRTIPNPIDLPHCRAT
jgi:mono/diheme cytochrome c family protein